jgi:hypothetical protein
VTSVLTASAGLNVLRFSFSEKLPDNSNAQLQLKWSPAEADFSGVLAMVLGLKMLLSAGSMHGPSPLGLLGSLGARAEYTHVLALARFSDLHKKKRARNRQAATPAQSPKIRSKNGSLSRANLLNGSVV